MSQLPVQDKLDYWRGLLASMEEAVVLMGQIQLLEVKLYRRLEYLLGEIIRGANVDLHKSGEVFKE